MFKGAQGCIQVMGARWYIRDMLKVVQVTEARWYIQGILKMVHVTEELWYIQGIQVMAAQWCIWDMLKGAPGCMLRRVQEEARGCTRIVD